jgi:hypothetical protein
VGRGTPDVEFLRLVRALPKLSELPEPGQKFAGSSAAVWSKVLSKPRRPWSRRVGRRRRAGRASLGALETRTRCPGH